MDTVHHIIEGSGSSKGGGSSETRSAVEDPNTLQSQATARVLDLISEGECGGLVGNTYTERMQSIFFNDTPVGNSDGTVNFAGLVYDQRFGTIGQTYMAGFPKQEDEQSGLGQLFYNVPKGIDVAADIDAVRVTLRLPSGLFTQDTDTGDLHGGDVSWKIETKSYNGATWSIAHSETISGKTMSSYDRSVRVERVGHDPLGWKLQVTRTTTDSQLASQKNDTYWNSYTNIQDHQLTYDNSAYVGVAIDSKAVNAIPQRSYEWQGLLVEVPSNYDPVTRQYFGTWNGVFNPIKQYTDNPAWHVYALLTNPRFGLGDFVKSTVVDKYSFYAAAQYNDELVSDGKGTGGMEPRFTCNVQIMVRDDAFKVLQSVAAVMRASLYIGAGVVKIVQDRPSLPVKLVSKADITDRFVYSSTAKSSRHTACTVVFNDKTQRYLPRTIAEQDNDFVARYQYQAADLAGFGITSEGQARRQARWVIYTDCVNTEGVKFTTGLNFAMGVEPGDVVTVMDNDYANVPFSGKIGVGGTTTTIPLDRPVTLKSGQVYKVTILTAAGIAPATADGSPPDPSTALETRTVTSGAGVHSSLTVTPALTAAAAQNHPWVLSGEVSPRDFKILSITETERGQFTFQGISYSPNKYAYAEQNALVPPPVFSSYTLNTVGVPTNITFTPESIIKPDASVHLRLRVNWDDPIPPVIGLTYLIKYRRNNQQYVNIVAPFSQSEYVIEDALHGIYDVIVTAVNQIGTLSPPAKGTFDLSFGGVSTISPPTNLALTTGGTDWTGTDFTVSWTAPPPLPVPDLTTEAYAVLSDYQVQVFDVGSTTPLRTEFTSDTQYAYTFDKNKADFGPRRSLRIEVSVRDSFYSISAPVVATFTNTAPGQPTGLITQGLQTSVRVYFAFPAINDYAGTRVWLSQTSQANGFIPTNSNFTRDVLGNNFDIPATPGTLYYLTMALLDTFGAEPFSSLTLTTEIPVRTASDVAYSTPLNAVVVSLATTSVALTSDGVQHSFINVRWTATTDSITGYEIGVTRSGDTEALYGLASTTTNYRIDAFPNTNYNFRVREVNGATPGPWSNTLTVLSAKNTVAPAAATGLSVAASFKNIFLNWTNPNNPNIDHIEIWRAPVAPTITNSGSGYAVHDVLTLVGGTGTPATFKVVSVAPTVAGATTGPITNYALTNAGSYSALPSTHYPTTTTGTGVNAQFTFSLPDNSSAVLVATTKGTAFTDSALQSNTAYFYWLKVVDTSGNKSAFNQALGIGVVPAQATSADYANLSIVNAQISDLAVDSAKIADASIINAKIGALAVTTEKVDVIDAVKINVSGSNLSTWQDGTDGTKISGGAIKARTISAQQIAIGNTNVNFNIVFSTDNTPNVPSNVVRWNAGTISYTADNGAAKTVTLAAASSVTFVPASGAFLYIFWTKDATQLSTTYDKDVAFTTTTIVLGTYAGGSLLSLDYGRTILDGNSIATGTIGADKISANSILSNAIQIKDSRFTLDGASQDLTISDGTRTRVLIGKIGTDYGIQIFDNTGTLIVAPTGLADNTVKTTTISTGAITDDKIAANSVNAGKLVAGSAIANLLYITDSKFALDGSVQQMTISDATRVRVRIGKIGTDYGIQIYDNLGNVIVSPTGLGPNVVGATQLKPDAVLTSTPLRTLNDSHSYYMLVNTDAAARTLSGNGPWDQDNTTAGKTIPIWLSSNTTPAEDPNTDSYTAKQSYPSSTTSKTLTVTAAFDVATAAGTPAQATIPVGSNFFLAMYAKLQIFDTTADPTLLTDLGGPVKLVGTANPVMPFLPGHFSYTMTINTVASHNYQFRWKAYCLSNTTAGMSNTGFMKSLRYDVQEAVSS